MPGLNIVLVYPSLDVTSQPLQKTTSNLQCGYGKLASCLLRFLQAPSFGSWPFPHWTRSWLPVVRMPHGLLSPLSKSSISLRHVGWRVKQGGRPSGSPRVLSTKISSNACPEALQGGDGKSDTL